MNRVIYNPYWSSRLTSLQQNQPEQGLDSVEARWRHRGITVGQARLLYPRFQSVGMGLGFVIADVQARPAPLPGQVDVDVRLVGAFTAKLTRGGAASAHSESPSDITIPEISTVYKFARSDILICEPTYEVYAVDNIAPDTRNVGKRVSQPYGGGGFPPKPPNPLNLSYDISEPIIPYTIHYPWDWTYLGVEYKQYGYVFEKRYYYAFRHMITP